MPAPPKALVRSGYNTLDVRGERVDAAVGLAEKFLDDALRTGSEAVFVIHGHGTGALRESLRRSWPPSPASRGQTGHARRRRRRRHGHRPRVAVYFWVKRGSMAMASCIASDVSPRSEILPLK